MCVACSGFTTGNHHAFVPDAPCRCGHPRAGHSTGPCLGEVLVAMGTDRENCRCRAFVAAGPDGPEPRCEGCGHTDTEGCGCPPPGLYGPECSHEAYEKFSSTAKCADCGHTWSVEPPAALPPSEGPEYDKCACGHERHEHSSQFLRCGAGGCFCDDPDYSAAAGETAGEPECLCSSGSPENYEGPARDCPTHGEPEARYCGAKGECRDPLKRCGLKCRREFPQCRAQFHGGSVGYRCQLPERHSEPHTNKIPDEGTFNWDDSVAVYPTEPEAPCPCIREGGCCHAPGVCLHGCAEAADEVTRLGEEMEPEAPEHSVLECKGECIAHGGDGAAPPRPPYAVAYATGSGVLNEIALPGDATAAVTDGALVISHPSGVLGIQHVKPWEGA